MSASELDRIRSEYMKDYRDYKRSINHPWHPLNPVAIYYRQTRERAVSEILRKLPLEMDVVRCLDIGCGFGGFLQFLASSGIASQHLHGIDIMPERSSIAKSLLPSETTVVISDAAKLPYPDECFNLVSQLTVISSILDPAMRANVCNEMQRTLQPGGYALWYDMYRTRSSSTTAIPYKEVLRLFQQCRIVEIRHLHSHLASRIVNISQNLCTLLENIPGFPKTHLLILLQKK